MNHNRKHSVHTIQKNTPEHNAPEQNTTVRNTPEHNSVHVASYTATLQEQYMTSCQKHKRMIHFARIFILIQFFIVWEILSDFDVIDAFFFSSPSRMTRLFISMCQNFEIFYHIAITLFETILSFLIVNVISILVAILLLTSNKVSEICEPYLVVLNSLPKSALAPLIIVWLGTGMKTIIVAGISVAVFGSIITLYSGFCQVDEEKMKLIYTLGGNKADIIKKVIIPSSVPIILSNMKVNIGLSLVGVIIGEFLAAKRGLGYLIIYGSQVFQLDLLILSILILCMIAMLLYQSIRIIERKLCKN